MFRNKLVYPVYMTIGNIPKELQCKPSSHTQILIGYIPLTRVDGLTSKAAQCCAQANLFHFCLQTVLGPISSYGLSGIAVVSGNGIWHQCHPIFANFIGDYPEQNLVACTYSGQCSKCIVPRDQLGEFIQFPRRNNTQAMDLYRLVDGEVHVFHATCRKTGLKPVFHPFWESLPFANVFVSITPDVLHQLLQGVLKHLIKWLTSPLAFGTRQINTRCRSLPPNHHIKTFPHGISALSRVSGQEHKEMCRILLALILDLSLPSGLATSHIIRSVCALIDFIYLAQLPSHTTDTIHHLNEALVHFHENKAIFVDLGICKHFNIPKFHSLTHYCLSIGLFGSTDNYNTEQTERLHIDFVKNTYRATNYKDKYPQMMTWLEHHEKVEQHMALIARRQQVEQEHSPLSRIGPPKPLPRCVKMAQNPSVKATSFDDLTLKYGAVLFQDALADFIAQINYPKTSPTALKTLAVDTLIPFHAVPSFHKVKFISNSNLGVIDTVHIRPEQCNT